MEKIGNIVTTAKKNIHGELFNVVHDIEDCIEGLPTLVIGWKMMKELYNGVNILEKEYKGVNWTFNKTERRCEYEEDILEFYNKALNKYLNNIKYTYVDLINFKLTNIKKMIRFLRSVEPKILFLNKDSRFLFVYCKTYNVVFGISLTLVEYMGINKKKVLKMINNGTLIKDLNFINDNIRSIIGVKTHYILPLYNILQ